MHLKHFSIGAVLILIGIAILSPFDEIFILIPLSTILGLEIIPVVMFLGVICVALGIFLVGKSSLVHMGWIGVKIAHHPVVILGSVSIMCILFYWWLMYGP